MLSQKLLLCWRNGFWVVLEPHHVGAGNFFRARYALEIYSACKPKIDSNSWIEK